MAMVPRTMELSSINRAEIPPISTHSLSYPFQLVE
jgi:hypothetical protein